MLIKQDGVYKSSILADIDGLIHGFTTKKQGNMRDEKSRLSFFRSIHIPIFSFTSAQQTHGTDVHLVKNENIGRSIPNVDGLVYKDDSHTKTVILGVNVADCVPLLLVDPTHHIIAAVHSGWKGTLGHIVISTIQLMLSQGAQGNQFHVVIGPYIGPCCYQVNLDRVSAFQKEFSHYKDVICQKDAGTCSVDLGRAIYHDLCENGVDPKHIDNNVPPCTSCHREDFFSFRRDTKKTFGEMLGFIGYSYEKRESN